MKLHKLVWHDPDVGVLFEWFTSKAALAVRERELRAERIFNRYVVEVPTRRAELIAFLNHEAPGPGGY